MQQMGRELARASPAHFAVGITKADEFGKECNSGERVDDERDSAGECAASGNEGSR